MISHILSPARPVLDAILYAAGSERAAALSLVTIARSPLFAGGASPDAPRRPKFTLFGGERIVGAGVGDHRAEAMIPIALDRCVWLVRCIGMRKRHVSLSLIMQAKACNSDAGKARADPSVQQLVYSVNQ